MREENIPSPADSTPGPVAVNVISSPDSSGEFEVTASGSHQAISSRFKAMRILLPAAIAGGVLLGPEAYDASREHQSIQVREKITQVADNPSPAVFNRAQFKALQEFYPDENGAYDYESAKEMMEEAVLRAKGVEWQLPAGEFISGEDAKISEDGKTVEIYGRNYSFAKVRDNDGSLYIIAAKPVEEGHLVSRNRTHMVSPMLMGGARFKNGMNDDEQVDEAYANARENIAEAFEFSRKPSIIVSKK